MAVVDATGPIFLVLVGACLFYLVPRRLAWKIPTQEEVDKKTPLSVTMKTVHQGRTPDKSQTISAQVSTDLTRRAARREAYKLVVQAKRRRKAVLTALIVVTAMCVPFAVATELGVNTAVRWWVPVAGLALIGVWIAFSGFESRKMTRQWDAIIAETELADAEQTVAIQLVDSPAAKRPRAAGLPTDAIVGPNGDAQLSLWEPLTVVPPTYISSPTKARTVRTIDLKPPQQLPVTADGEEESSGRIAV